MCTHGIHSRRLCWAQCRLSDGGAGAGGEPRGVNHRAARPHIWQPCTANRDLARGQGHQTIGETR
eukprot:4751916-Prymnesium_polylepis.1